jgi:hypothetical protein
MEPTKAAIAWRLYAALSSDAFRQMFGAKHNSIDFDRLIAERKVVVVKGGFDALGEEGMRVFLQFLVAQYYAAGMRRLRLPERERHLNLFICDEASHILTTPVVSRMLFDLRKVACGVFFATQVWEQVSTEVKAAVLGNTALKCCGPLQHNDASVPSREMYCDISFIRSMQRNHDDMYAPWAMYVNGMTKTAARVTVPFGTLERLERINPDGISSYEMPKRRPAPEPAGRCQQQNEFSLRDTVLPLPGKQEGDTYTEVPPSQPVKTGAHEAIRTVSKKQKNASTPVQSDNDLVVNASKRLEALLVEKYGASGKGFGEKFISVKDKMPKHLHEPASRFTKIRNLQIHKLEFALYPHTRKRFIEYTNLLEDFLNRPLPGEVPDDDDPMRKA